MRKIRRSKSVNRKDGRVERRDPEPDASTIIVKKAVLQPDSPRISRTYGRGRLESEPPPCRRPHMLRLAEVSRGTKQKQQPPHGREGQLDHLKADKRVPVQNPIPRPQLVQFPATRKPSEVLPPVDVTAPSRIALKVLEEQLLREKRAHERTKRLLFDKTEEIRSANAFLDQTDARSYADIIMLAQELNNAILQVAAMIADSMDLSSNQMPTTQQEVAQFYNIRDSLGDRIGAYLVGVLDDLWPGSNPSVCATWIQYAIQSYLVTFCANFLSDVRWSREDEAEEILCEVYKQIRSNGPHAIAGRWRALTHKAWRDLEPNRYRPLPLTDHVLGILVEILLGIGAWDSTQDLKAFLKTFRGPTKRLITVLFRLDVATKEDIITADILPLSVGPGTDFDFETMEDEDGADCIDDTVLATVMLGLQMKSWRGNKENVDVILKPKVILSSMPNQ